MKITAVILTKNEEKNIERCLKSINFCDQIIIIDDYSKDKTVKIVHQVGVGRDRPVYKIYEKKLNNDFASQRNFGLSKASNDWILFIDADEVVSEELKKEIVSWFHGSIVKENAFYLRRRDYFWEQELRFGEIKKVRNRGIVRLVKKNSGTWMGSVHEVFHTASKVGQLNGYLNHYPHPTLKEFINDINYYSSIRAKELFNRGVKTNIFEIIFFPFSKFVYNYFFNLGFLDGPAGFTYAFMMSFHSFLVRVKLYQLTNKQ
ncbi:MAG: glycosyltransferase family 2 protein [Candidatus Roizmanbacteria bacterium]|nr:glycosyltransferase family 2 protein [Candidatus Roizmanbacteria bacterium]